MSAFKTCLLPLAVTGMLLAPVAGAQTPVPGLTPKLLNVVSERACLGKQETELCARIHLDLETTGQDWLDLGLLKLLDPGSEARALAIANNTSQALELLRKQASQWLGAQRAELQAALDEDYFTGFEQLEQVRFLWQRGALAAFVQSSYSYSGGAHGMGVNTYRLMDLDSQRWLDMDAMLLPGQSGALLDLLLAAYREQHPELAESWLAQTRKEQVDQLLTDNILPLEHGLRFNYPPYVLGSYADGQVELVLSREQLQGVVRDGLMPAALAAGD